MRRRLFTIASGVSLALCLATMALSARSHRVAEVVIVGITRKWEVGLCSQPGTLGICIAHGKGKLEFDGKYRRREMARYLTSAGRWMPEFLGWSTDPARCVRNDRWGHEWISIRQPGAPSLIGECWFITPRYWKLEILLAILPALWLVRVVRARRKIAEGCCRSCGYNLTANTSGKCPECGTPVNS